MELIVKQLSLSGIKRVFVTTHYLGDKIEEHFGNGQNFGIEMLYIAEEQLLGTAGGVKLVPEQQSPMLIVNGDILTEVDFRAMHAFHAEHEAELTVGVRQFTMQVPYGVIESDGWRVKRVVEKPMQDVFVNAGIYLMEPHVQTLIPAYQKFDMTDLITLLVARGSIVACFPIWEYWRDIGQPADYEQAQSDIRNGKLHS
jgi:NDP-sugar pyrophosphorylase family protein